MVYGSGMMKPRYVLVDMDYARFSKQIHQKTMKKVYCCRRSVNMMQKGWGYFQWIKKTNMQENKESQALDSNKKSKMVQLRAYVEMKKEISNKIYDNILGKMSDMGMGKDEDE